MARVVRPTVVALLMLVSGAWIQAQVTPTDITRLETTASQIESAAGTLKRTDATLAADVLRSLAEVRDEVTYLKVRLRREGSVPRAEYMEIRDRLETLRTRAGGQKVTAQPVVTPDPDTAVAPRAGTIAVGTEFDARLLAPINSATARVDQRFEVLTLFDITAGNVVIAPAGTLVRGFLSSVRPSGRIDRKGSLTMSFDEIVLGTRHLRLRASVMQAFDPKVAEDISRFGTGAVLGGLIGGAKGALAGILIGPGGTIVSTEGADVDLPNGAVLRLRLDQPLDAGR